MREVLTIALNHHESSNYQSCHKSTSANDAPQDNKSIFITDIQPTGFGSFSPSVINVQGWTESFYVDEIATHHHCSRLFRCARTIAKDLTKGESTLVVLQEINQDRRVFLGQKVTGKASTLNNVDWTGLLPSVLQSIISQQADNSCNKTPTMTKCSANVSVALLDITDATLAYLTPDLLVSDNSEAWTLCRGYLQKPIEGMIWPENVPRISLEDARCVPRLLHVLFQLTQSTTPLLDTKATGRSLHKNSWSLVVYVECRTISYNESDGSLNHRKSSATLVSLPPLNVLSDQELTPQEHIAQTSNEEKKFLPLTLTPLQLIRDSFNSLENKNASLIKTDNNLHINRLLPLSASFRSASYLLKFLEHQLLNGEGRSIFIGEICELENSTSLELVIETLQMLSSARFLRHLTSSLPLIEQQECSTSQSNLTGYVRQLETKNSRLQEGLSSALALQDIELRLLKLESQYEEGSVKSLVQDLQTQQILHLKELCSCLRYHFQYSELLEEAAAALTPLAVKPGLTDHGNISSATTPNESLEQKPKQNCEAAVSFVSNQRRLVEELTRRFQRCTEEEIDEAVLREVKPIGIEIVELKKELKRTLEAHQLRYIAPPTDLCSDLSEDLLKLEQAKIDVSISRVYSAELEQEVKSLKESQLATRMANDRLRNRLAEQSKQLQKLQADFDGAQIELSNSKQALEEQQEDFHKSVNRRKSLFTTNSCITRCYDTPWSTCQSKIVEHEDDGDLENSFLSERQMQQVEEETNLIDAVGSLEVIPQTHNFHTPNNSKSRFGDNDMQELSNGGVNSVLEAVETEMTELELELMSVKKELRSAQEALRREAARQQSDARFIQSLESKIEELNEILQKIKEEKQSSQECEKILSYEIDELRCQNANLREMITAKDCEIENLNESVGLIATQRSQIRKLQATADGFQLALQSRISTEAVELLKQEAATDKALCKQLSDQVAWMREAVKWNEKQLDDAQATIREQNNQINKYQEDIKRSKEEIRRVEEMEAELLASRCEKESGQFRWEKEKAELEESLNQERRENKRLYLEKQEDEKRKNVLQQKMEDIDRELEALWMRKRPAQQEMEQAEGNNHSYQNNRENEKDNDINCLTQYDSNYGYRSQQIIQQLDDLLLKRSDLNDSLEIQLSSLTSKLLNMEMEKKSLEDQLRKSETELTLFKSERDQQQVALKCSTQESEQINRMLEAKLKLIEERLIKAVSELATYERKIHQLELELVSSRSSLKECLDRFDEINKRSEFLSSERDHNAVQLSEVKHEMQKEKERHEEVITKVLEEIWSFIQTIWGWSSLFRLDQTSTLSTMPNTIIDLFRFLKLQKEHIIQLPDHSLVFSQVKEFKELKIKLEDVEDKYHKLLTHNNPKQKIHHHLMLKQENAHMKKIISDLQYENALLLSRRDHLKYSPTSQSNRKPILTPPSTEHWTKTSSLIPDPQIRLSLIKPQSQDHHKLRSKETN